MMITFSMMTMITKALNTSSPFAMKKTKANWGTDGISWYYHVEKLNHEDAFEKT
jgi:hypothetical protein